MDISLRCLQADTWIFDLDNTLYPVHLNLFGQIEQRITEFVASFLKVGATEARKRQKDYYLAHGTTLRGLMLDHGLEPAAFLDYVHDIDLTKLMPASRLDAALATLSARKIVFTNGSARHAARVLERLGIARHFEGIYDIAAADYLPKPAPVTYERMCRAFGVQASRAVMVEDMARNLAPAHALGMATILVAGGSDHPAGELPDHVHHLVDDLDIFLSELAKPAN